MPSSMSPASRKRRPPTSPSSTIDTLLIAVPPSAGSRGTAPRQATAPEPDVVEVEPIAGREPPRSAARGEQPRRQAR